MLFMIFFSYLYCIFKHWTRINVQMNRMDCIETLSIIMLIYQSAVKYSIAQNFIQI